MPRPLSTCVVCWLVLVSFVAATSTQESPQEVDIIKQINRVNDDGSYTFGYEAADGSFKIETRDVLGNVKGMFGFVDENGELKRVSYNANNGTGFRAGQNLGERPLGLSYTTTPPETDVTRRPVLVLRQPSDSTRAPVIQQIPRRRLGSRITSTTTPAYGDYLKSRRPHVALPSRSQEEVSSTTPKVTEEPDVNESPPHVPLGRIIVTKIPATGKGGNHLRRQLTNEPESNAGDVADVYTGGAAIPRYVPAQSIRSPQSSLLANLPPHVAAALRQQQLARAAAAATRPYPPDIDAYPVPIPSPRPSIIDEQEYPPPIRARSSIPPVRSLYRPVEEDDGPTQIPFPMASLRSLRDELMDYIYQYLQFRLGGGNPYIGNPYHPPYQNPYVNPNLPYPAPLNFGGGNPNVYNPYAYPNLPFGRNPYQPPVGPLPYPQGPYPPIYPGQNFPQPLPFNSPNKQLAAQQYSPNVRSAPKYEQFTPSQRLSPESYNSQMINPAAFESQRYQSSLHQRTASRYEQADSKGTADSTSYALPPADVLRMMLARGLPGIASTTSTTTGLPPTFMPTHGPIRNVKIIGASSSVSLTTVKPPTRTIRENPTTEPTDEMEMQA